MSESFRETFARVFTSGTSTRQSARAYFARADVARVAWWFGLVVTAPVLFWPFAVLPATWPYSNFLIILAVFATTFAPLTTPAVVGVLAISAKHVTFARWTVLLGFCVANALAFAAYWIVVVVLFRRS